METILVTGATGFLGKYIVEELASNNYNIIAIGRNENKGKVLERNNVEFRRVDLLDYETVEKIIAKVTMVIHAAALSTVCGKWEDFYKSNVEATEHIAKYCLKYKVEKLVYVSSPSIYTAKYDRLNIKENEFDENNDMNYYIKSKILSEKVLSTYIEKGLNVAIVRPRGLFGVGDTSIIPRIMKINKKVGIPLINQGENIVDITCVENVALALRLCLESDKSNGNIYNITNGEPIKFKKIIDELYRKLDEKPKYINIKYIFLMRIASALEKLYKGLRIYKEPMFTIYTVATLGFSQTLSIEKAREDLGYIPKISLQEGIDKYVDDYIKCKEYK